MMDVDRYELDLLAQITRVASDRRVSYWRMARPTHRLMRTHSARWVAEQLNQNVSEDTLANAAKAHRLFHALWKVPAYRHMTKWMAGQYDPSKWEVVALWWTRRTQSAEETLSPEELAEILPIILKEAFVDLYDAMEFSVRETKEKLQVKYGGDPTGADFRRMIFRLTTWRDTILGLLDNAKLPRTKKAAKSVRRAARKAEELQLALNELGKEMGYELREPDEPF